MTDETTTSALPGEKATMPDALDLRTLALIGVIAGHDGPAALLRSSRGQIARVAIGDDAFGVRVTAIGDDQVILTNRWGQTESLQLPRS